MATIDETVSDFLRDAQYRVAEFTVTINEKKKEGYSYSDEEYKRAQLILWMDLLYESRGNVYEGYNFLESWSDRDIQAECEYLRKFSGMGEMPIITFAGYSPEIRQEIIGQNPEFPFPYGDAGDILVYTSAGYTPVTQPPTEEVGYTAGESIDEFFD